MKNKPSIHDVQNYYLSFFGSLTPPKGVTTEEITKEVQEDIDERYRNRKSNKTRK